MSTEMLFFAIVTAGITAVIILLPFFTPDPDLSFEAARARGAKTRRQQSAFETLQAEKYRVLRALRDLDVDYDMNKLPDTIYTEQRIYLIRLYGALVLRLDELAAEIDAQQDRLETALAAYRSQQ